MLVVMVALLTAAALVPLVTTSDEPPLSEVVAVAELGTVLPINSGSLLSADADRPLTTSPAVAAAAAAMAPLPRSDRRLDGDTSRSAAASSLMGSVVDTGSLH